MEAKHLPDLLDTKFAIQKARHGEENWSAGCVTVVKFFGNGTNRSTVMSWYQHLLHPKAALSSPKEQK